MGKTIPLFSMLRRELGSSLAHLGYVEAESAAGQRKMVQTWARQLTESGQIRVLFLRYHRPWLVEWLGNQFTVELEWFSDPDSRSFPRERIYFLLDPEQFAEMRAIHEQIVARLPVPEETAALLPLERTGILEEVEHFRRPWNRNQEVWFRYRTA